MKEYLVVYAGGVDSPARVARVLPRVREMAPGRLITLADVEVVPE